MANKAGNSKRPWQDARKKAQAANRTRQEKRKAARIAKQKAAEARNKKRPSTLDGGFYMTPWEKAKAARAERRKDIPMKPRTAVGNIIEKDANGHQSVRPGSKREIATALKARQDEHKANVEAAKKAAARKAAKKAS